ncbi:hypothetical protein CLOSCI_02965 [[Clostridium] scindens ATCC 35704]|nr:hypothetical protein CLOSCI_02965 [[Clostridium] scindens ATCC 35704]
MDCIKSLAFAGFLCYYIAVAKNHAFVYPRWCQSLATSRFQGFTHMRKQKTKWRKET